MVTDRDRSVVQWVAVIGAVSAQDVVAGFGVGRTVGYGRLRALVDHGLLLRARLVYGQPAPYTATREGLAWAEMPQLDPARRGDNQRLGAVRSTCRESGAPRAL